MRAYPYLPGVPAAGHITSGGFWHPGSIDNCNKCNDNDSHRKATKMNDRTQRSGAAGPLAAGGSWTDPQWCKCGCLRTRLCTCAVECSETSHRQPRPIHHRHEYEPGDVTHPMHTDPNCRVCGEAKH